MVGSACHVKQFITGCKPFTDDEETETEVQKWLRKQSKDFCATCFNTLVKRWDECINVGGDMLRNKCFFGVQISGVLCFISICDLFTESPSQKQTFSTSKLIPECFQMFPLQVCVCLDQVP
jgi:hypothetical protein